MSGHFSLDCDQAFTNGIIHGFFVARNLQIFHRIIKDAESRQILHFAPILGAEHCNINYNVACSGTPYNYSWL
jgi:hypothetical protein